MNENDEDCDVHEVHLIPEYEDDKKHYRNQDCWCEPTKRACDDYYELDSVDMGKTLHQVWEHRSMH